MARRRLAGKTLLGGLTWAWAAVAVAPAHAADDPADWPTYNHDAKGWRCNPAERTLGPANVGRLVERWRFPAPGDAEEVGVVHATPAVVAGEVYFGTATYPAVHKLDVRGRPVWTYRNPARKPALPPARAADTRAKLRFATSEAGFMASPLVADGAVFIADVAGWMYCLDAATGAERWKVNTRAAPFPGAHALNILMASPIRADGKVVFAGGAIEQALAGSFFYAGSTGRGFVVALDPADGRVVWKHDVGPPPQPLDPPLTLHDDWGRHVFKHGPATSSIWCTPSWDERTNTLYFGTDVNTAPRRPTPDNPALHTPDSCAVRALDARTGHVKWSKQLNPGDVWTNSMRGYDPQTGRYKDLSVGDTPKPMTIAWEGRPTDVVGAGCKDGGFYLLRAADGVVLRRTPLYQGPPTKPPAPHDPRVLALPSSIGGLQTGCATDGVSIFCNGIDALQLGNMPTLAASLAPPTGGRVTALSLDLSAERWRHERPKLAGLGGTPDRPRYRDVGDPVASGLAVGNGVAYCTTVASGKLLALDAATGKLLKEIDLGPVFAGPALSRGRVYVGGGNTLFNADDWEAYFPKQFVGGVRCFGLPD